MSLLSRRAAIGALSGVLLCFACTPDETERPQAQSPIWPDAQVIAPSSLCGDRLREQDEVCDDGNTADGDYCAADCSQVTGKCGDGVWQTNESCEGAQGYFGPCTEQCAVRLGARCLTDAGEPFCEAVQLSGVPHSARIVDLDATQLQPLCEWMNRVKAERRQALQASYVLCSGFKFTYDEENCGRQSTTGAAAIASLNLGACDLSVLEYERCQLEVLLNPCQALRLDGSRVQQLSPCWTQACASTTLDAGAPAASVTEAGSAAVDAGVASDADLVPG